MYSFFYAYRRPLLFTLVVLGAWYLDSLIGQKLGTVAAVAFAVYLVGTGLVAFYYGQRRGVKEVIGEWEEKNQEIRRLEQELLSERQVVSAMTSSLAPEQI